MLYFYWNYFEWDFLHPLLDFFVSKFCYWCIEKFFVFVFFTPVYLFSQGGTEVPRSTSEGQRAPCEKQFSPWTMWVPGTKLKSKHLHLLSFLTTLKKIWHSDFVWCYSSESVCHIYEISGRNFRWSLRSWSSANRGILSSSFSCLYYFNPFSYFTTRAKVLIAILNKRRKCVCSYLILILEDVFHVFPRWVSCWLKIHW